MILSQTSIYALKAALYLAERGEAAHVRVDDIAEQLDVPRNYLSKILHSLARGGVLASSRGPGGGFRLARPASELTLSEVVGHFGDVYGESTCLLGRDECSDRNPCAAHDHWKSVSAGVQEFFSGTSVADLSRSILSGATRAQGKPTAPTRRDSAPVTLPSRIRWSHTRTHGGSMAEEKARAEEPSDIPFFQRLYDRPFVLLAFGMGVMLVLYTAWGLWEVMSLPQATLP